MSDLDPRVEPFEQDVTILPPADDEDVPARRLLAHDRDDDGEEPVPPPD